MMTMVSMLSVMRVRVHWSPWIVGWNVRVAGGGGSRSPWIVGGWVIAGSWRAMRTPWIVVVVVLVAWSARSGSPWIVGWSVTLTVRVARVNGGSPWVLSGRVV